MGKITINELHKSLYNYAQAVSDKNLMTESKTIVGAINEIYGKNLIADSIGEPLNDTDTYSKMSSDINNLLSTFKTNMMNAGVAVESNDKFKSLIEKIKGLTEGEGNKGIQYTKLTGQWEIQSNQSTGNKTISIPLGLDFTPSIIICYFPTYAAYGFGGGAYFYNLSGQQNVIVANNIPYINAQNSNSKMEITNISSESISISNGFYTPDGERYYFLGGICTEIYAIGVGEEDTTLRDSLASILKDEGVNVTEEDTMASLITKVDEEFDNRKQILVNALVNEGLNAKITNTYEELIAMISLLKYVPANSIINGDSTDSDFINGLTSYSRNRGDADSKITYSVSNNTIIVEGSADCVETTNGQADEGKRDLYIYNPSYTVDVTDYDVFKVIASYSFYDMEYGSLEVGLYTGSDYKNPVKTIENGDLNITDLTGEYHIVINAFVWNEYYLGKTGILKGKVSYIGFE